MKINRMYVRPIKVCMTKTMNKKDFPISSISNNNL